MLKRITSFALLVWILGFAWFAFLLPQPAGKQQTDAVVVLTGGANRIDHGLVILEEGQAKHMLISGVDRDVRPEELAAQYPGYSRQFKCCVELGFRAVDTRSNALETARWVSRHKIKSLRLITHDWHMRRARLELDQALPNDVRIVNDAVMTRPSLFILFKEYNKYWLRRFAALIGL
ncbi:MAG: YdcF family protein [Sphingomonadales bacterium]|nr:YdcF family protein [Sphingomonadales bacterium]